MSDVYTEAALNAAIEQRQIARGSVEEALADAGRALRVLGAKQDELCRAVEAAEAGSIDEAPALARTRFDADAQAVAAGRQVREAEEALSRRQAALTATEHEVKRLAAQALTREVRSEFERLRVVEATRISIRARLLAAYTLAPSALNSEEWNEVDRGSAVSAENMALGPMPMTAVRLEATRNGLPTTPWAIRARAAVLMEESRWLEELACLSGYESAAAAGLHGNLAETQAALLARDAMLAEGASHIGSLNGAKSAIQ